MKDDSNWISFHTKIMIMVCLLLLVSLIGLLYFAYIPSSTFFGNVISHKKTDQKIVALTFDDGPNGQATLDTLGILSREHVPGTFFLVGQNVDFYPQIAKQIVLNGNEVENHSYYHSRTLPFAGERAIELELQKANQAIFLATGQTPKFFRPPHGFRTPWAIRAAQKAGFRVITWNDLTSDYKKMSASSIKNIILAHVTPGTIIDLHDGSGTLHGTDRTQMLQALPEIIDELKAQGYSFLTVSQMFSAN